MRPWTLSKPGDRGLPMTSAACPIGSTSESAVNQLDIHLVISLFLLLRRAKFLPINVGAPGCSMWGKPSGRGYDDRARA